MAEVKEAATEAIGASISAGQSLDASMKERGTDSGVQLMNQSREKPSSQTDIVAEKIVSGKDGTVTTELHNFGSTGLKGAMSNNFVDDSSTNIKLTDVVGANPTKVVHTMHINGTPTEQAKAIEIHEKLRETNISQNTILGEEKIGAMANDELS